MSWLIRIWDSSTNSFLEGCREVCTDALKKETEKLLELKAINSLTDIRGINSLIVESTKLLTASTDLTITDIGDVCGIPGNCMLMNTESEL